MLLFKSKVTMTEYFVEKSFHMDLFLHMGHFFFAHGVTFFAHGSFFCTWCHFFCTWVIFFAHGVTFFAHYCIIILFLQKMF